MTSSLPTLLSRFAHLDVVVVGDALLDVYLDGHATKLCREAPVPVVEVDERVDVPGGAGNVAMNLAALGATSTLVSLVGEDDAGAVLRRRLTEGGVDVSRLVVDDSRETVSLQRVTAGSQVLVRVDTGSEAPPAPVVTSRLVDAVTQSCRSADAVIVSDYGRGVLQDDVVAALQEVRVRRDLVLTVDSRHPQTFRHLAPTAAKPNWSETVALLGTGELDGIDERAAGIAQHGDRILELTGARIVAVTLDAEGAMVFERGRPPHRTYARPANDAQATGSGDTFVAALTLALASGADTPTAAEIASAAANAVVRQPGTVTCTVDRLREQFSEPGKVVGVDGLPELAAEYHAAGRRVVFTNGCFDILHRGHITYLNRSKTLGDVLVVGVNDDDSVRTLKGPDRPINRLEDRVEVLAALSCVDHIVPFSAPTPTDVITTLRPDVYTKGGDYTMEALPEARVVEAYGGEVQILPLMEDRSTTGLIARIREDALHG